MILLEIGIIYAQNLTKFMHRCVEVGVQGAVHNVHINLKDLKDQNLHSQLLEEANKEVIILLIHVQTFFLYFWCLFTS